MSKINTIIPKSNFEYIRSLIPQILSIELCNQAKMIEEYILNENPTGAELEYLTMTLESIPYTKEIVDNETRYICKVYEEREMPINLEESASINIIFKVDSSSESNSTAFQVGETVYQLETWQRSSSSDNEDGDKRASRKAQRILALCHAILNDKNYKQTLGLGRDNSLFIGSVNVHNLTILQADKMTNNFDNEICGVLDIVVRSTESNIDYEFEYPFLGSNVTMKIDNTTKSIYWETNY